MFRKILIAMVASLGLMAPLALPVQSEAREIEAVSNHCYRVYFRTCNREAWRFRGEFHNRQAAYRTAHHLREHGFEVVVR